MDPKCHICLMVDGPPRRFVTKVDPFKETRSGFRFTADMVTFDWRATCGAKYAVPMRCVACHMFLEITLVTKDDWYDKFEMVIKALRECVIFQQLSYEVVTEMKLDNDSVWSKDNERWGAICKKWGINCIGHRKRTHAIRQRQSHHARSWREGLKRLYVQGTFTLCTGDGCTRFYCGVSTDMQRCQIRQCEVQMATNQDQLRTSHMDSSAEPQSRESCVQQ